jgi:hypothetical protein
MKKLFSKDAVKRIYEDTLKNGTDTIRCFTNYKAAFEWDRGFFEDFYFPSRVQLGIKVKNIAVENREGRSELQRAKELLREMRFIQTDFTGEINIWQDSVAIISFNETPSGVLIEKKVVAEAIKSLFDCLWNSM